MAWMIEEFEDLDNPTTYAVDPQGVYDWIESMASKLEDGKSRYLGKLDTGDIGRNGINEILVCGMGGSAISGDLAYSAVQSMLPVPYRVVRGYEQPASLGENTLQIIISYSGNTEEAIWAYTQGHNRNAKIVVISSGGALKDLALKHGYMLIELPGSYIAPRLATGHILSALLAVLISIFPELAGIESDMNDAVTSLRRGSKRYSKELDFEKNFAKRLAHDFHGVFPVIASGVLTAPVAMRFQAQFNENSKWPAHFTVLPEMNHNEIVAFSQPGPATKRSGLLVLRDRDDHPRVQYRQDFTIDLVEKHMAWVHQLKGDGKTLLGRLMSMVQTADYSSYYLACARGLNPLTISAIDSLKERLGKLN